MTDRELMRQALEALEDIHPGNMTPMAEEAWNKAITALRERLAQPERQGLATDSTIQRVPAQGTLLPQRPQNCGTSYCSCIECVMEPEQSPLDRMAENARELGLDYEPEQKEKPDGRQTTGPLTDRTDHVRNGGDYTPAQTVRSMGAEWRPFLVEFTTQEGDFTVELWAVDWVHAQERLEELKDSARIKGETKGAKNDC